MRRPSGARPPAAPALPNSAIGSAPSTTVSRSGIGAARARDLLDDERRLEKPEPGTAVRLRHRDAEEAGLGDLGPELAVEARAAGALDLADALVGGLVGEDLLRRGRRSACCSSLNEKSMARILSGGFGRSEARHARQAETEHADQVALDLVGAAAEGQDDEAPVAASRGARRRRRRCEPRRRYARGPMISMRMRNDSR